MQNKLESRYSPLADGQVVTVLPCLDKKFYHRYSRCGSVGRAVASEIRDLQFKSSHSEQSYLLPTVEKTKIKKRGREWPIKEFNL